ncbi:YeeE/YedE family protein [Parvibaculum sedimenti]|uniref:YeeE/YedE family protein n=1 Tax=Parvibaculum sedimenti TaxID=2608632 RepID=A0A6N6VGG7_9HYPH|nr:YeeE/YedE family protein [Parvibaculum sedimenti]KAB7739357.1 YeeE/YedE family protein [Parvibaculum sedimenti]
MEIFATAAAGGALIGLAAAGMLLVNGSIAGISGIFGNALAGQPGLWRWTFLAGLIAAPLVAPLAKIEVPAPHHQAGLVTLAIAGLLVGIGTRLSGGCTSGHGVCGLSNLSRRSLVATGTFMLVAALTVYAVRHLHLPVGF